MKKLMAMVGLAALAVSFQGKAWAVQFDTRQVGWLDNNNSQVGCATCIFDSATLGAVKTLETDVQINATPVAVSATTGANGNAKVLPSNARWFLVQVQGKTASSFVECSINTDDQGRGGGILYRQNLPPIRVMLRPSATGTTLLFNVTGVTASSTTETVTVVYGTK